MGAAVSTSVNTVINNQTANVFQEAENTCTANCVNLISGTTIVLTNTQTGNITFDQQCSADASCYMSNAVSQTTLAVQTAVANGMASPSLFPGIQVNTTVDTTENDISLNLTQILQNFCHANVSNNTQNTLIYATNSKTGDIGFTQNGNANAACVMENTARMQLNLQQAGTATGTAGSQIGAIAAAIIAIVVIVVIIVALTALAKGTILKKKPDQTDQQKADAAQKQQDAQKQQQAQQATRQRQQATAQARQRQLAAQGGRPS